MGDTHNVEEGEQLSGLAEDYGFYRIETIWDAPENADLKQTRQAHVLNPGDQVFIPDKQDKEESRPTGQVHTFQVPAQPLKLRIALTDFDNQPMPGVDCELEVEGKKSPVTSDGDGVVEVTVPKHAQNGVLRVPDLDIEIPLQIGYLDPEDQDPGWKARIVNLGYYAGPEGDLDDDFLRKAVEEFQRDQNMSVTGDADAATIAKLKEVHGC